MADETKQNLARPAPFVADRSLTEGDPPNGAPGAPDTFVNVNPRIAEGLLEGIKSAPNGNPWPDRRLNHQ